MASGRWISVVYSLPIENLDLEGTASIADGTIMWPEDTDKMEEAVVQPNPLARL